MWILQTLWVSAQLLKSIGSRKAATDNTLLNGVLSFQAQCYLQKRSFGPKFAGPRTG